MKLFQYFVKIQYLALQLKMDVITNETQKGPQNTSLGGKFSENPFHYFVFIDNILYLSPLSIP